MFIDISKQIQNLQAICKDKKISVIIFDFSYQKVVYKCVYTLTGEKITIAPEGYNIAINISIKDNKLNNFLGDEEYLKLKEIHSTDLKTKVFCDNMLTTIANLTGDMVLRKTAEMYRQSAARVKKINENDNKTNFYCWSRSFCGRKPSKGNLEKTRALGEEFYLICKENNISSRWKNEPTKNSYLNLPV